MEEQKFPADVSDGQDDNELYFLGLDIGTTTVKSCLIDRNGHPIGNSFLHYPEEVNVGSSIYSEQDVRLILDTVDNCMLALNKSFPFLLDKVERIGICGQMHGVCMWKYEPISGRSGNESATTISNLVNWMDQRCDTQFLSALPCPTSHLKLSSGHGCATLFWLQEHKPEEIAKYDSAGTIMDHLVAILCDLRKPVISTQNAASWGYFDCSENSFNFSILESAHFPCRMLPVVLKPEEVAGQLEYSWLGIKPGTVVGVALGDLQCSVYSAISGASGRGRLPAFVNISTSAQITYVSPKVELEKHSADAGVEYFPYFNDSYLAVGASLNGGNVLATFVQSIQSLLSTFGQTVSKDVIWKIILERGSEQDMSSTSLSISPLLFGERHCPDKRGSITNISSTNQSLGSYTAALCSGLVQNLSKFIPPEELSSAGIDTIVATGSALLRNPILQAQLTSRFKEFKVKFTSDGVGAEYGAAGHARFHHSASTNKQKVETKIPFNQPINI